MGIIEQFRNTRYRPLFPGALFNAARYLKREISIDEDELRDTARAIDEMLLNLERLEEYLGTNQSWTEGQLLWITPYFGDGSDGDVTVSSTITLTRDMYYNNLEVTAAGTINTAGYRIFVRGILTLAGNINSDAQTVSTSILGNGGAGGAGGSESVGSVGTGVSPGAGGAGGGGGAAPVNAGGAGGGVTASKMGIRDLSVITRGRVESSGSIARLLGGGGGGGGGSDAGDPAGGAGGGGGGVLSIAAKEVHLDTATGTITSHGGDGNPGTGTDTGGGGGGGGGVVLLLTLRVIDIDTGLETNNGATTYITVTGGSGGAGTGGGASGSAGNAGTIVEFIV